MYVNYKEQAIHKLGASKYQLNFGQRTPAFPTLTSQDRFIASRTVAPPHFGMAATTADPLKTVEKYLQGDYSRRITDEQRVEYTRGLALLRAQQGQKPAIWLKPPMSNGFLHWPPSGSIEPYGKKDIPLGWVYYDTQLLNGIALTGSPSDLDGSTECSPKLKKVTVNPNHTEADYHYEFDRGNFKRKENLSANGAILTESFSFENPSDAHWKLYLKLNLSFRDLLKVRSNNTPDPPSQSLSRRVSDVVSVSGDISGKSICYGHDNTAASMPKQTTSLEILLPKNEVSPSAVSYKLRDSRGIPGPSELIELSIPPGASKWQIQMGTAIQKVTPNSVEHLEGITDKQIQAEDFKLPEIIIKATDNSTHGTSIFHTASGDLPNLTLNIQSKDKKQVFFPPSAGIPNFVTLFGRDSIITSLFLLPFQPEYARQTLLALADYQGTKENPITMEAPGKIMHELRYGPATASGLTPHTPYYGTLDATPLFIILYKRYLDRTGDTELGQKLLPNVLKAMACITSNTNNRGYLVQAAQKKQNDEGTTGLQNIGWKDNKDAMRLILDTQNNKVLDTLKLRLKRKKVNQFKDPEYPLAPAEIQAYLYEAYQSAIAITAYDPNPNTQAKREYWQTQSDKLKEHFNKDFWMEDKKWLAIALDAHNEPVQAISSNGAQALMAAGLLDEPRVIEMMERMTQKDIMSGWGIRTLASSEPAYNPIAYHNGTIWAHDNGMIALAARAQNKPAIVQKITEQLFEAARYFPDYRLPELHLGLSQSEMPKPLAYPRSCIPQAWASATPYALLSSLLGLSIDAQSKPTSIRFQNPTLPKNVECIEISQLPLSKTQAVDIRAMREGDEIKIYTRPNESTAWEPYSF